MKGNLYVQFSRKNYQFGLRTYQHPCVLLKHHFISTLYHSDMIQPSKNHPQGVQQMHFNSKINKMSHQIYNSQNLMCLTVHRSSMWKKKPTRCHLVLYLFLLYKLLFISCSTCFGPPCAHLQEHHEKLYFSGYGHGNRTVRLIT